MLDPNSPDYENIINFMRADLESGMGYTKLIENCKSMMARGGRDFEKEYKHWRYQKEIINSRFLTNAQMATKLGISKRQISKIKKRIRSENGTIIL